GGASQCYREPGVTSGQPLQVLPRRGDRVDRPAGLGALAAGDQGADVDDPLALLTGDPRPIVGVGGVRQVFVLPELVYAGVQQVPQSQPLALGVEVLLDRPLLPPVEYVLGPAGWVALPEAEALLDTVACGH